MSDGCLKLRSDRYGMKLHTHLGWVSAVGIVGDHIDGHIELWELNKCLILVCTHIELGLDDGTKGRAQLPQLLLCRLVWQIANVQHLEGREKD